MPDLNGSFEDCVTALPMNNTPTQRVSAAMGYLGNETRRRSNLTILTEHVVERLAIDGARVSGVQVRGVHGLREFSARETIVSAGAIHSPALLMRSGIGPAQHLKDNGIAVTADHPGVGRNLQNHPIAHIAVHLPRLSAQHKRLTSWAFALLRYSSRHPGCPPGDMIMFPANRTSWHPLGRRIGVLGVCVYKTYSTGSVALRSADPAVEPDVKFHLLSDDRDFERMVDGFQHAARILAKARVQSVINETFLPSGGQANALNRPSYSNWLKSAGINLAFDLAPPLRRRIFAENRVDVDLLARDRGACEAIVRKVAAGVHHAAGTCRMGREDERAAVVDPCCRIHRVEGLRVVDASVMPTVVSANTHLAVLMIAEKVTQMIRDGR
jgi:5-(hydroxymethyl)furfural/furfural oxidase